MIPIVTPKRMGEIDAAARQPVGVLIDRAGAAVARAALEMMGGRYGRRVVVVAGPGNNGADGRAAARRLRRAGVRVSVVPTAELPPMLPAADLYVDAAFGTGLSRPYGAPERARPESPVLAVDIPSGLNGLTGEVLGGPVWAAQRTVTFAALKPGLLFGDGPQLCGRVAVADIGLEIGPEDTSACALLEDADITALPAGTGSTHKWHNAALVVAGSPGMGGAAALVCGAALRSGARMVHLSTPAEAGGVSPIEVVRSTPPLLLDSHRFTAVAAGPGLGTSRHSVLRLAEALAFGLPAPAGTDSADGEAGVCADGAGEGVGGGHAEQRRQRSGAGLPVVVDADGLRLLRDPVVAAVMKQRLEHGAPTVLTPHDSEFESITGSLPGVDRIAEARSAAAELQAVVLLKGGPTVVAHHDGRVRVVGSGAPKLATAGTGDVLTGVIVGRLAAFGSERLAEHVAEAAHLHGRSASAVGSARLLAGDLLDALNAVTP